MAVRKAKSKRLDIANPVVNRILLYRIGVFMISKFAPKRENKLIDRAAIKEELKLIDVTDDYYITPSGKIYRKYGNKYYPRKTM